MFCGVPLDGSAISLDHCEFPARLDPVLLLAGSRPDVNVVDRGTGEIKLKCEVLAGAIDNGVFAEDKIIITQVSDNFVVPVFNSYGLPLTAARFPDAIA